MKPFLVHIGDERHRMLRTLAQQTELSMAEVVRRLLDGGFNQDNLNEAFPFHSGRLTPKPEKS